MRVLLGALVAAVLLAGCSDNSASPPSPAAGEPLGGDPGSISSTRYYLNATLQPPITTYNVVSRGANPLSPFGTEVVLPNESHTYTWSTTNTCGRFEKLGNTAIWHHGDDTNCDHDSPLHAAKIVVVIGGFGNSSSSTGYGTCEYAGGSSTGQGDQCFVSSVAPEGLEPARRTSIPWSLPASVAGVAVALLLLRRARA